jgi:uncharacterized membrane protein
MKQTMKKDKGTAGLTILLSVIVLLFVIGLLIMIFTIMGSKLQTGEYDASSGTSSNESLGIPTTAGITLTVGDSALNGVCGAITEVYNATGVQIIGLTNFTQTGCTVKNASILSPTITNATTLKYTYSYTYDAENTATTVMNDTTQALASTVDYFDIFIVITAMVVLILLTVIIITAIRTSGLIEGAGSQHNASNVGSA